MALTTLYQHGQQQALRILKTKWDVTRKQVLKHIGQLVTLCYCCWKAAATSSARMCPLLFQESVLLCLLRTSQTATMYHVEEMAIWCIVKAMTLVQSQPHGALQYVCIIYCKHCPLQGSSLECLLAVVCWANVGQCGRLHKLFCSEKKKKKTEMSAHVVK